jgi:hypothetical protein
MTGSSNGQGPFKVIVSEQIKETIKTLHERAKQLDQGVQFLATLRRIFERLQRDPQGFGEPLFRLPALNLMVLHVVVSRVVIHYGVHQEKPLVIIRNVTFLD